ncbi:MAG: response regulator [Desulfohalobiaceae bacterium]|nr:response regulator [Desulfohalobiaceae bacterium]
MSGSEKARILLVDEDRQLLELLTKRLQRDGFSVKAAFSEEEALEVVTEEDFDVAVVDQKIPGMEEAETQRRLQEVLPFLQFLGLTRHGSSRGASKKGQPSVYGHLSKPIDYESLLAAIRGAHGKKLELERRAESGKAAALLSGRGVKKVWDTLRGVYRVPEQ